MTHYSSPEDDKTVSSSSLCIGAASPPSASAPPPAPVAAAGADIDSRRVSDDVDNSCLNDARNGNIIVSESTSMDVLSGGESDAGDTLNRRNNNNSISTRLSITQREGAGDAQRRRGSDITFFIARELLMTERTYKRDLELITVAWSARVSALGAEGAPADVVAALARPSLALEPLALAQGGLLARLERALVAPEQDHINDQETEEPEYRKIAELLSDYLSNTCDAYAQYSERSGPLVGVVESVRRRSAAAARACAAFEAHAPLPLACLLLRPLHRLLHYHALAIQLAQCSGGKRAGLELAGRLASAAARQLRHVENHAALCQLQRDIGGYDKLLVAEREFIQLGCVYKHSTRGLQQKMLFLFSDVAIIASKAGSSQFRAHAVLALQRLQLARADLPHSFTLAAPADCRSSADETVIIMLSASNEAEFKSWYHVLEEAIANAREKTIDVDTELTPYEQDKGNQCVASSGSALTHVCWHRATSLARDHLHTAMRSQLSGYLLRKFKNSHGWQKLWVVFAAFTLFFYKSWHDEAPLASLPLLGYTVGTPSDTDAIFKDYVFKLQFKSHVYFFRADSQFTYNSWNDVLKTAMVHYNKET